MLIRLGRRWKGLKCQPFLFLGMPISSGFCGKPELCQVATLSPPFHFLSSTLAGSVFLKPKRRLITFPPLFCSNYICGFLGWGDEKQTGLRLMKHNCPFLFSLVSSGMFIKLSTMYNRPQAGISPELLQFTFNLKKWMIHFCVCSSMLTQSFGFLIMPIHRA